MRNKTVKKKITIIGAGPAGLACAYELTKKDENIGKDIYILEKNNVVGGLARSYSKDGYKFDIGPHRFYTKNEEIGKIWKKLLGRDLKKVKRLTRILYKGKLFLYPIKIRDVISKLGFAESSRCFFSFIYDRFRLWSAKPKTFEDWIIKYFGARLYEIFFKTYTEKVWGISCKDIGSEWAAQRIKNLNFLELILSNLPFARKNKPKSLIEEFYYPKKGAGQMYEKIAAVVKKLNAKIFLNTSLYKIKHKNRRVVSIEYSHSGKTDTSSIETMFCSMPITDLIFRLSPSAPKEVVSAARKLFFRDHITVNLLIKRADLFPDNWIYIHDSSVKMARVTNYNNFGQNVNKENSAVSVEYFVFKGDELWSMRDTDLIELAHLELRKTKLIKNEKVISGFVVRETESYPTYYLDHKRYFNVVKKYLDGFKNIILIGRGGMYKYNNMDHSMFSGILAARNYLLKKQRYNLWKINDDATYLE